MAYRQKEYNYNDKLTKDQNLLMDKLYNLDSRKRDEDTTSRIAANP